MALTVAELQVVITAQAKRFQTQIRQAEDRLKKFETTGNKSTRSISRGMTSLRTVAGPALAALGIGATAAGFISASNAAARFADQIAKTADKVGVSTTFLQEFQFAAERTGVQATAAAIALQRFGRRAAEAAQGTGATLRTFQQLGVAVRDVNGRVRTTEELLPEVADALKLVEGDTEQLRLAFTLFDTEGAALVNTLRNGSEGLNELRQAARDAGVVIDESLTRRAEDLNDRFDTVASSLKANTLPVLLDLKEGMTLAAEGASFLLGKLVDLIQQPIVTDATIKNQSALTREIVRNEEEIDKFARTIARLPSIGSAQDIDRLNRQIKRLKLRNIDLQDGVTAIIQQRNEAVRLASAIDDVGEEVKDLPKFQLITPEEVALTEEARNVEINRIREAFFRQEELNKLREEAIGVQLKAIEDQKEAERVLAQQKSEAAAEEKRTIEENARLRTDAVTDLVELERQLDLERAAMDDPLRQEQQRIDEQIREAQAQREVAGPENVEAQIAGARAVGILQERRREVTQQINDLEAANAGLTEVLQARATALLGVDRQRAITLQEQLDALIAQSLPLEELQEKLREILSGDVPATMAGPGIVGTLATGFSDAVFTGLSGGLEEFGGSLLDTVIEATSTGTETGFEDAQKFVTQSLSKGIRAASGALGDIFGGAEGGGVFGKFSSFLGGEQGGKFLQSAIGFGARAIKGFQQGAEIESQAAGQVASAVTSVQRVRGIVAGPTSLAVAQVDRAISDAFIETNFILRRIEENTRATATQTSDTGTGSVPTGGTDESIQSLANEGASLI